MHPAISLRERKKRRTWEAIASGTVALVVERGFEAVRVEQICERAEVGRSTFFRYFDSLEAAFVAGIHRGRLESVALAIARRPEDEDLFTALRRAFVEVYSDWREQRELMLLEARIRAESTQVKVRALGQQVAWEASLAEAIEPRLARGPRRTLQARLLAAAVVSAVRLANDQWIAEGATRSPVKGLTATLEALGALLDERALARPVDRPRRI